MVTDTDEARKRRGEAIRKALAAKSPEARSETARKAAANRDPEVDREAIPRANARRARRARKKPAGTATEAAWRNRAAAKGEAPGCCPTRSTEPMMIPK